MIDRISGDLGFYQEAVGLRQKRMEVLAANIANADTPNYKARDFDFTSALRDAMAGGSMHLPDTHLTLTSTRHIPAKAVAPDPATLLYRQPLQPSMDGNTVDMDVERVAFADNTAKYQTDLQIISARIKGIMAALQQ
ncbi:flagellar basal body rod protein FlgB [Pollutimonas thiosulfatoxidans]|uniref:Flagellar basal body rod protein FlgB n=1 Tax=Pollutimonas thiosulfatoxidans TaxID=2028345 RepID=A0A410G9H8_9BURK|nr:flagellar basal body rod protein FlgB [Pollutimonas thiosulfatoxidans]MBF6617806.1 flagellar basal body rod protein FlgB [Candidimonas sp.]QAA92927.1 flagellar basal body rod protein FlgB [Pollutimonas thiosulfatoxidans]